MRLYRCVLVAVTLSVTSLSATPFPDEITCSFADWQLGATPRTFTLADGTGKHWNISVQCVAPVYDYTLLPMAFSPPDGHLTFEYGHYDSERMQLEIVRCLEDTRARVIALCKDIVETMWPTDSRDLWRSMESDAEMTEANRVAVESMPHMEFTDPQFVDAISAVMKSDALFIAHLNDWNERRGPPDDEDALDYTSLVNRINDAYYDWVTEASAAKAKHPYFRIGV